MARVGRPPLDTKPTKKLSVEVTEATMQQVDAYIAQRQAADPGAHLSRSDVLRELLARALQTAPHAPGRPTRKGVESVA